jgi:hypothetical protein
MDPSIEPTADGIFRGILPSLQAEAMIQVVGVLPVVEDFIAILDG